MLEKTNESKKVDQKVDELSGGYRDEGSMYATDENASGRCT